MYVTGRLTGQVGNGLVCWRGRLQRMRSSDELTELCHDDNRTIKHWVTSTFWISLRAETKLPTKTELNPKSEVTFLIWTQRFAKSEQFGLSPVYFTRNRYLNPL